MPSSKKTKMKNYHPDFDKVNINHSLPYVLQPISIVQKIYHEMVNYHWLWCIFYGHTTSRMIYIVMRSTVALFALMVVYVIFGKRVLHCETRYSRHACNDGNDSSFVPLLSLCMWDDHTETCHPTAIDRTASMFVVTIIGIILYTPIISIMNYIAYKASGHVAAYSRSGCTTPLSTHHKSTPDTTRVGQTHTGIPHTFSESLEEELRTCSTGTVGCVCVFTFSFCISCDVLE